MEGSNNVYEDILTRWSKDYRSMKAQTEMISALYDDIMTSPAEMIYTMTEDVRCEQRKHSPLYKAMKVEKGTYLIKE